MRILYLHHFDLDLAGGSGTYLRALCGRLTELGHSVDVVSARAPDQYGLTAHAMPFEQVLTFGPEARRGERLLDALTVDELEELIATAELWLDRSLFPATRPDLVLVNHLSVLAAAGGEVSQRHGVPYRLLSYGTDTELLMRRPDHVPLFSVAVEGAERVFTISRYVSAQVRQLYPRARVEALGGAVDEALFRPATRPHDRTVTFVGRLVGGKGLEVLLDAAHRFSAETRLLLVGEGPLAGAISERLSACPPDCDVELAGYIPPARVGAVLAASTVVAVPSTWQEPLGLVVLEAQACGVPVVATAVGGIPEIVRPGDNGLLVDPGDADALAAAVNRILDDQLLYQRLRTTCLDQAVTSYGDLAAAVLA